MTLRSPRPGRWQGIGEWTFGPVGWRNVIANDTLPLRRIV